MSRRWLAAREHRIDRRSWPTSGGLRPGDDADHPLQWLPAVEPQNPDLLTFRYPHRITLSVYGASTESYDGLTRRKGALRMFEKACTPGTTPDYRWH